MRRVSYRGINKKPNDEKTMYSSPKNAYHGGFTYNKPGRLSTRRLVIRSTHVACRHQKLIHDMLGFHYDGGGGSYCMTPR